MLQYEAFSRWCSFLNFLALIITEQCFITHSGNSFSFNFGWDTFLCHSFFPNKISLFLCLKTGVKEKTDCWKWKRTEWGPTWEFSACMVPRGQMHPPLYSCIQVRLKSGGMDNYMWFQKLVSWWVRRVMVMGHALPGSGQQVECCSDTCWDLPCLMTSSVTWRGNRLHCHQVCRWH